MTAKSSEKKQIPAVEGAFTWPADEPCFIASRCKTCGSVSFPRRAVCRNPACQNKTDVEEVLLTRRGKLLSYTQMSYKPPPPYIGPDPFVPFAIGEVAFPEGIAIIGQMTECNYEDLKIGAEVEMVIERLYEDEDGNDVVAWKFRPI